MSGSVLKQVANLNSLSHNELRNLYITLHGSDPPGYNRQFIIRRLAHRIQEIAHGSLSQEAHRKMDEVLERHGYDENGMPANSAKRRSTRTKDLPVAGSRLIREWKGRRYEVTALEDGFEFEGRKYRFLSAIANVITGTHWNGKAFFGCSGRNGG